MDTVNIAVLGALGVGKTSFIQRALRLNRRPISNTASIRQDVDGIPYVVTLIELDLEYFDIEDVAVPGQQLQFPKQINGQHIPRLDAALVLYDVMNKDSIRELPASLSKSYVRLRLLQLVWPSDQTSSCSFHLQCAHYYRGYEM